jgi:hypothetical protein
MKYKIFEIKNIMITLKAMVVGIVAGLPIILISLLLRSSIGLMTVLNIIFFILYLFIWGYFANKWWRWN